MVGHRGTRTKLVGALCALLLVAIPVGVAAVDFDDVAPNNVHAEGIQWMADTGVSRGCADNLFCPDTLLPREQMATFMYRLSGNDPDTPPSVNADRLDGKHASEFMTAGQLPRVAFAAASDVDEASVDSTNVALQATLTAPARGIVTATAVMDVTGNGGADTVVCGIGKDFAVIDGSLMFAGVDDTALGTAEAVCATSSAVVVDAGQVTIDLYASRTTATLWNANLWIQWSPLDGSGSTPASAGTPGSIPYSQVNGR